MSDIRKANPFIEAGFELLKLMEMPRREPAEEIGFPNSETTKTVYYGEWYRDEFNTSNDDCFYLSSFEPDFRSYYAVGILYAICGGDDNLYLAVYVGDYLREAIWHDFKYCRDDRASIGLRCALNGLSLVAHEILSEAQKVLIDHLHGEESYHSAFIGYPEENPLRFEFKQIKQPIYDKPLYPISGAWD